MDPERWPRAVRLIVDELGEQIGRETVIDVQQILLGNGEHYGWLIAAQGWPTRFQLLGHEPKPATTVEPAWYSKLTDLPPGGGTP